MLAGEEKSAELSLEAKKVQNKMRAGGSESGVEFAPWMKVDAEAIARAEKERKARKERAALKNAELEQMQIDPQAAELGGGGLKSKVLSEEEVELRWSTGDEAGNAGFIIQRRPGGSDSFSEIATFDNFAPLRTKGAQGGTYVYLDDTVPSPGTWVYRVLDCDESGRRTSVSQKLVEVDSASEQTQTLIVGGVIAGLALTFMGAALFIDPIQSTATGRF